MKLPGANCSLFSSPPRLLAQRAVLARPRARAPALGMASPAWYGVDPSHIPRRPNKRRAARRGDSSAQADASTALPPLTVVTFATAAYVRWLERLHTNLRLLALPAATLTVCAGDRVSQQAAHAMGLATFNFSLGLGHGEQGGVGERYGTGLYTQIVQAKSACIHAQLASLEPASLLFFVDGDVTLFADPRPSFLSLNVDLGLMADNIPGNTRSNNRQDCKACGRGSARACFAGRNNFNSGFFMMRSVESTRWLWRTMLSYHAGRPEVRQQVALNELIRNHGWWQDGQKLAKLHRGAWAAAAVDTWSSNGRWSTTRVALNAASKIWELRDLGLEFSAEQSPRPLTIAALDESRFLNGHCFCQRRPMRRYGLNSSTVLAVHHNYIDEDELKFRRAQAFGAVVENNDTMQTFLHRARAAMDTLRSWRPLCPGPRCSDHRFNITFNRLAVRNRTASSLGLRARLKQPASGGFKVPGQRFRTPGLKRTWSSI